MTPEQHIQEAPSALESAFVSREPLYKAAWIAIRPHQWVKNLLLFGAMVLGHKYGAVQTWLQALLGFGVFSVTASATYLLNDLSDVESDRKHATKKNRPIAKGTLSQRNALLLMGGLLALSMVGASFCSVEFRLLLVAYVLLNLLYTSYLKKLLFLDVMTLAGFYTLRLYAGGAVTDVPISHWLSGFSMFLFLSLGILKRFIEVDKLTTHSVLGREYGSRDRLPLLAMGCSAGYLSVVVFSLYSFSDSIRALYASPQYLWLSNFLLLYWVSSLWIRAGRGEVNEDPILFVIRDRVSLCTGALIACVFLAARFFP